MTLTDQLMSEIDAFLRDTGMAPTRFGVEAVSDPTLLTKLGKGRTITLARADRIRSYIRDERARIAAAA